MVQGKGTFVSVLERYAIYSPSLKSHLFHISLILKLYSQEVSKVGSSKEAFQLQCTANP